MSRYISVDDMRGIFCQSKSLTQAWDGFDNAPTIDIVRCKECENWQTDWVPEEGVEDLHYCAVVDGCRFGDFFCADGERRE